MLDYKEFSQSGLAAEEWDHFVDSSDNGTIFHMQKFLGYHPKGRFPDNSIVIFKNNKPLALLPATLVNKVGKRVLSSHGGASYGSFVYKKDLNFQEAHQMVDVLQDYAKELKADAIQMTPPPIIYQSKYSNYIDFALIRNGFGYSKREISSVVQLDVAKEDLLSTYRPEARTALKKAIKGGVEIAECDKFEEYYEILKKNLKMRHNVNPTHTLEELKKIKNIFPAKVRLWGAFLGEKLIAGVCNFKANEKVVLAFYISHDEDYQEYRGVNLLFYEIMNRSRDEGFKFLDFGIFTVNMDPNWGLGRFKENFGARGIFRDYFYKEL